MTSLPDVATRVDVDTDVPLATADPDRLVQVVTNLVVNGDQHGRGTVNVEVGAREGHVLVLVHDEGPGIAPEHREEVFERFARLGDTDSHSRGSGLGLFIARQLTRAMGGDLDVVDHPSGSAFRLRLSVHPNGQ